MARRESRWRQMGVIALIAIGLGAADAWGRRGSERCESCVSPYLPPTQMARGEGEGAEGERSGGLAVEGATRAVDGESRMR